MSCGILSEWRRVEIVVIVENITIGCDMKREKKPKEKMKDHWAWQQCGLAIFNLEKFNLVRESKRRGRNWELRERRVQSTLAVTALTAMPGKN